MTHAVNLSSATPLTGACAFNLTDLAATERWAAQLAPHLQPGMVVWLEGDLGAGKTALTRAVLRALGYGGPVKSPTYSLVEVYVISSLYLYHFDFYRFNYPEEFLDAGLGEYFRDDALCLVEWPEKAGAYVPSPDLVLALSFAGEGRLLELFARSPEGMRCLRCLTDDPRSMPDAGASCSFPVPPSSSS